MSPVSVKNCCSLGCDCFKTTGEADEECSSNAMEIKRNKVSKRKILSEVFNDYCTSTSIHGIGYLGAKSKSYPEKLWWIVVFILSVIACSYLITRTWIKWINNPIILSFEKEQIPIWQIPFPAVTICPVNKVRQDLYNYTKMFRNRDNLTDEEYKEFWDISLICSLEQYFHEFNCTFNTTDEEAIRRIKQYAPGIDTLSAAQWQNMPTPNFVEQITEEGLCFTFNSLSQDDMFTKEFNTTEPYISVGTKSNAWSMEDGYSGKMKWTDYPKRTARDGINAGLNVVLASFRERIDHVCGMPITGYKIILHNPAEIPRAAQQYFLVPSRKKVNIIIKPELTRTSKSLLSLSSHIRKCYFSHEKSLRFFKEYTQTNCRMECDANITFQYCGCVPFYMPREQNASICGYASKICITEVHTIILQIEMMGNNAKMTEEERDNIEFTRNIYDKCACLPSCNSLHYTADISQSEYHHMKSLLASGLLENVLPQILIDELEREVLILTHVDIFFKESQFYALQRSEIYGRVDFLANIGGLLGLFMGFSFLSLLEIIYFLTIRIWIMYKTRHKDA